MHRPNRAQPPLFTKGGDEDQHGGEGGRRHPDGRGDGWRKRTCVFFILAFDFPGDGCRGGAAGGAGGEAEGAGGALHPLHHGQAGAQVNL